MQLSNFRPYGFLLIALAFVLLQFFLQLSFGVVVPILTQELNLNPLNVGWLAAGYYFTYVSLQLPAGAIISVFGARLCLTFGALFCGLSAIYFSLSDSFMHAMFARISMGFGAAFAFIGISQVMLDNFSRARYPILFGFIEAIAMASALLGNLYLASLLKVYSWHKIFFIAGCLALSIGLLAWVFLPSKTIEASGVFARLWRICLARITNLGLWVNGIYCGLLFAIVAAFSGLWATPFLLSVQKLPLTTVTFESSMLFLGLAFGSPVAGFLYKRYAQHQLIMAISALITVVLSAWLIWWTPMQMLFGAFLFFMLGFCCCGYIMCYALATDLTAAHEEGAALGFTNTLGVVMAPVLQVLIGYFISKSSLLHYGAEVTADYQAGLQLIPIVALIALALCYFIPGREKCD